MEVFYNRETGLIMEAVDTNGGLSDSFDGRLLNPGHAIEAMWFVMDLANRLNRPELIEKAVEILIRTVNYGWDDEYGEVLLPLKGGKWKGCFHVPRGLLNIWKTLDSINSSPNVR